VTDARMPRTPSDFRPARRPELFADAQRVARAIETGDACLVNALSREQFLGTGGAHYGRPGRIPGSLSVPARDLIDPQTMNWRSREEIARRFREAGLDDLEHPVVTYCGGGIAASVTLFALRLLGHRNVALYDNSLLEWSADPARPMVR
jgi:thiosulfate/3-mercaptopyruvate sulfurtransferase